MVVNMQDRSRTGNQALVRKINLAMVMNQVRANAPVSRATVAEMTGLNKTTVSSLVQELLDYRLLRETGLASTGAGRPAVMLELNPTGGCFVSGEIGVDFISAISTNFTAETIWQQRQNTPSALTQPEILSRALTMLEQAAEATLAHSGPILGVALGVPGLVDQASGTLLFAPNLNWRQVPLRQILQARFTAPIFVDNEANLAALGEHYFGAAQNHQEVLYISAGVGLGGGIIREGQLFRGGAGFGGEFGPYLTAYRLNSRLLVAQGPVMDKQHNDTGKYAVYFYLLKNGQLQLLKQRLIPRPADSNHDGLPD